ncbi:MAG: ATP synthase F1 subunit delta [Bacteroidales bacterium]|nr:ATP synthase F1 subunit delta [Bacteroidales bacterium]
MKSSLLTQRYAKAFMELAIQTNLVDKVLDDLLLIKTTIEDNKDLLSLINQPFVSKEKKLNVMVKLFADKVEKIVIDMIHLLIEKNRETIIVKIYDAYYDLYLDYKKIAVVTVTTAVPLDEKTTARIVNIVKHKIVKKDVIEIKNVVDKSIIGGFVVNYMDFEYDGSVRNTLKRLHSVFEENLFIKEY